MSASSGSGWRLTDREPDGATPLDPDDAAGLIPGHILTRGELNAWEQANIARAHAWLASRRSSGTALDLLFVRELHRRMLDQTWRWAGEYRTKEANIGVPPHDIAAALRDVLDDAKYWIAHATYATDEIGARFHHRVVQVHPFPNGNGRHGRLITDTLLRELGAPAFGWGAGDLVNAGEVRARYIAAMRRADEGDYAPLFAFVRSGTSR